MNSRVFRANRQHLLRMSLAIGICCFLFVTFFWSTSVRSQPRSVAVGTGGAVASVDERATQIGIEILRNGGNAVDAAMLMFRESVGR